MTPHWIRTIALTIIISNAVGCATIVNRRYQQVEITSEPERVVVTLECAGLQAVTATTPATLSVKRRATPCEVVGRDGGREQRVPLKRGVSRAFWANLIWSPALAVLAFTGSDDGSSCEGAFFCTTRSEDAGIGAFLGLLVAGVGMAVDGVSGAMFLHEPPQVEIRLPPLEQQPSP